jgi:hypothetical protein
VTRRKARVVRITAEGFSKVNTADAKLIRPSGLDLRDGDPKPAKDCTFGEDE